MTQNFNAEKDVESFFRSILEKETKSNFVTAKGKGWQTDGIIEWQTSKGKVSLLLEAKFNKDLTDLKDRSTLLAQVLYYYNRLQKAGKFLPELILAGDENYSFLIPFSSIESYLDQEIDWSRPPSSPDPNLKVELDVFLYETNKLDGAQLKQHCENLNSGLLTKIKPSKENLSEMYQYWVDHIFPKDKYSSIERAHIFYNCICYSQTDDNCAYLHPTKKNILVIDSKEYEILVSVMNGFFNKVQRGLSAIEIDELVSIRDRIVEEDTRRRQGAFYTPSLWVDEAHVELEKVLGETWKEDCIVWDSCAGTGNLTRDYHFQNLILSTAELTDIQVIKREGYNESAEVFQYDFLNPESESPFFSESDNTLPLSVKKMLKEGAKLGKRLIFLINPPYATARKIGATGISKAGVANTTVNQEMKRHDLGPCSQQLYAQFLFQCDRIASEYGFKQKSIGVFSPILYMVSGSFSKFRSFWYSKYSYQSGFMFQASQFADVKGSWAISFAIWNEGTTELTQDLSVVLKEANDQNIISLKEKALYSATNKEASKWVTLNNSTAKKSSYLTCRSGLVTSPEKTKYDPKSLLYFVNDANSPYTNGGVYFVSLPPYSNYRFVPTLCGEGWRKAIALFSARKLTTSNWTNDKNEYLVPVQEEGYEQWVDDCHIYALLHSSNNTSAMRGVDYKDSICNIHNHFFWLTRKEALELYGTNREARSLYRDAKKNPIPFIPEIENDIDITPQWRKDGDPYFSQVLSELNLSSLALEVLQDLNEIFVESLHLRKQVTHVNERGKSLKLHLDSWDAGVYQLKKLWYTNPDLKVKWELLRAKHLRLAKQLQPGVYKYGFLK